MTLTTPLNIHGRNVTQLIYTLVDNSKAKRAEAFFTAPRSKFPLVLWQGAAYDAAGDWTSAQEQARILALQASGDLVKCF